MRNLATAWIWWGEKVVQDDLQMKNHDNLEKDRRPYENGSVKR